MDKSKFVVSCLDELINKLIMRERGETEERAKTALQQELEKDKHRI